MTDHLPYTRIDVNGTRLTIGYGFLSLGDKEEEPVYFHLPQGQDAVDVARAVLAAAGLRGHEVMSQTELLDQMRVGGDIAAEEGARSMRDRGAEWLVDNDFAWEAEQLRALPLLPDEDTDDENPLCLAMSPTPDTHVPYECEGAAGHEGEHHALRGSVTWEDGPDDEVDPVLESPEELAQEITRLRDENAALRSIGELEELVADQANAIESHSQAIADLRTQMSSAQAAIRGLGQSITPTTTDDL